MMFELTEEQVSTPGDFFMRSHFDENAIVYINGKIVAKLPGYNAAYEEIEMLPGAVKALQPGKNVIAVSVQNTAGGQYFDIGLVEMVIPQGGVAQ